MKTRLPENIIFVGILLFVDITIYNFIFKTKTDIFVIDDGYIIKEGTHFEYTLKEPHKKKKIIHIRTNRELPSGTLIEVKYVEF